MNGRGVPSVRLGGANVRRVYEVHGNSSHKLSAPDVALAELAAPQHGVVTVAQLLAAGLDRDAIADAALSHRSAGALWRILPRWSAPPDVTARSDRRKTGIRVHRARRVDATTHYGIPVTTPARTLVDLADVLPAKALTRALNEAQVLRLVTANELTTLLTRYPGRRTSQLTPERAVDAVYREQKLVIELDSRQFHTTNRAFEQDRDRDADILNAGFATLRITDHRLKEQQAKEARRLNTILQSRSPA